VHSRQQSPKGETMKILPREELFVVFVASLPNVCWTLEHGIDEQNSCRGGSDGVEACWEGVTIAGRLFILEDDNGDRGDDNNMSIDILFLAGGQ
jgi:hypothetical protein